MEENINQKRVLFIITQSEMGGVQRFLYNLIPRLDQEKYQTLVAIGSDGDGEFLKALTEKNVSRAYLSNLKRDSSPWHDIQATFEIRKLIKKFQPHILFLNSSKAGFLGSLATIFPFKLKTENYKLKTIYRIGGWTFNDPWPKWKKRLWIFLERISARWKDVIIVNNRHDFQQAQQLKIKPREKLALVHNGIDAYRDDFLPPEEARLKLFEKISRYSGKIFQVKTVIGAIANFYPAKGLADLVAVAEEFKDDQSLVFLVIGEGQEREKLETLIKAKELDKKILLLGRIPDAYRFLPAFDIFILPSLKEGFPWSVLEAMSAKIPVIATKVGAIPEIIEDEKSGLLVDPASPKQIAQKIKRVIADDRLRQELAIHGHQVILFKFSLDKMVKKIEELLG